MVPICNFRTRLTGAEGDVMEMLLLKGLLMSLLAPASVCLHGDWVLVPGMLFWDILGSPKELACSEFELCFFSSVHGVSRSVWIGSYA